MAPIISNGPPPCSPSSCPKDNGSAKPGAVAPGVTAAETEAEGEPSTSVTATTGKEDLASWNEDAEKALGNIRLRLHDINSMKWLPLPIFGNH